MISLPKYLNELILENRELTSTVYQCFAVYERVFSFSNVPFFRDYTDHGPEHVAAVIRGAEQLIITSARERLTAEDGAVLAIAALLHDAALHISEEGFLSLIRPGGSSTISAFGDREWSVLWQDYIAEAVRWDSRKGRNILGEDGPLKPPPSDPRQFQQSDYQLIGEFLRRHHHRLAHEIAVYGFPGAGGQRLQIGEKADESFMNLAGLVARSHGIALRDTFQYMRDHMGGFRTYRRTHPVYLMVLLRIADYLEIESGRAPSEVLTVRRLRSPLSYREWAGHAAIDSIEPIHDDPEAIYVHANPENVDTYLKLKALLRGIQNELDTCWAVLGEVYGRTHPGFGIRLRRVYSNLDDEIAFERRSKFLPRHVAFRTAGSDLLKLLIKPLYGNRPEIGIRELVQNAVDAVRTRRQYDWQVNGKRSSMPVRSGEPEVTVSIESDGGKWWVVVRDEGIGMDADSIINYFLTAGATSRTSQRWKQLNVDAHGRAQIVFIGRFGIGLLAAFILGDEVEVRTRHAGATEEEGYEFTASIDADSVEVRRCSHPIGTTIRVPVTSDTVDRLTGHEGIWDWYCLTDVRVQRISADGKELRQRLSVPGAEEYPYQSWRRMRHPDFAAVDWTPHLPSALVCNGILVTRQMNEKWDDSSPGLPLTFPAVSVIDPDARLPLTIARDRLSEPLPFTRQLLQAALDDYLAFALATAPTRALVQGGSPSWYFEPPYWGFTKRSSQSYPMWLSTTDGVVPADAWHLKELDLLHIFVLPCWASDPIRTTLPISGTILPVRIRNGSDGSEVVHRLLGTNPVFSSPHEKPSYAPSAFLAPYQVQGCELYVDATVYHQTLPAWSYVRSYFTRVDDGQNYTLWRQGACSEAEQMQDLAGHLADVSQGSWPGVLARWTLRKSSHMAVKRSAFADRWKKTIGSVCIPYDLAARKQLLSAAFTRLDWELQSYRASIDTT